MTRELFEKRLRELHSDLLVLASMVEKAVRDSVQALWSRDLALSRRIVDQDAEVNALRYQIEEKCVHTMATQQPMAADLRDLLAVLFIASELERIGDHAEGTARISLMLGAETLNGPTDRIGQMAEKGQDMLRRSLHAFLERDADQARVLCDEDDEVDRLYESVIRDLIAHGAREPGELTRVTYLMWTAHNLERVADRVTNICERVIFMVTGELREINVSRY